jgi:hypothetical protein
MPQITRKYCVNIGVKGFASGLIISGIFIMALITSGILTDRLIMTRKATK